MLHDAGEPSGLAPPVQASGEAALAEIASLSNARERRAIDVEREVQRVYASSLMRDRIGDDSWGTISGVNPFGVFVTLDSPFVEGLIKIERLPGYLDFDAQQLRLIDHRRNVVFSLGDRVRVRVMDTSVRRRQFDLELSPGGDNHEPDPDFVLHDTGGRRGRRDRRKDKARQRPGKGPPRGRRRRGRR